MIKSYKIFVLIKGFLALSSLVKKLLFTFGLLLVALPSFSQPYSLTFQPKTSNQISLPYDVTLSADLKTGIAWDAFIGRSGTLPNNDATIAVQGILTNFFYVDTWLTLVIKDGVRFNRTTKSTYTITLEGRHKTQAGTHRTPIIVTISIGNSDLRTSLHNNIVLPVALRGHPYNYVIPNDPYPGANNLSISYAHKTSISSYLRYSTRSKTFWFNSIRSNTPNTIPITMTVRDRFYESLVTVVLTVDDGDPLTLNIGDFQAAPIDENLTLARGHYLGITVGATSTNTITTTIVSDSEFTVNNVGRLIVANPKAFNYETLVSGKYVLTIQAFDARTVNILKEVTLTIANVDEPPVFKFSLPNGIGTIFENTVNSRNLLETGLRFSAADPEGTSITFASAIDKNVNPIVTSEISNGTINVFADLRNLASNTGFDYETQSSYPITIFAGSNNLTATVTLSVNIIDVDEPPVFNRTVHMKTGQIGAGYSYSFPADAYLDPEGSAVMYTTSTIALPDGLMFTPATRTFATSVNVNIGLSAGAKVLTMIATGGTASTIVKFTMTVATNAPPDITVSGSQITINENSFGSEVVSLSITVVATDVGSGTVDETDFTDTDFIITTNGAVLMSNKMFDYELNNFYTLTITSSDTANAVSTVEFTLSITDVNEAPDVVKSGTHVGTILEGTYATDIDTGFRLAVTDFPGDTFTYTYTDNNFHVVNGMFMIKAGVSFDYETMAQRAHTITVTATDSNNLTDTETVTINISNVDEPPIIVNTPTIARVDENVFPSRGEIGANFIVRDPEGSNVAAVVDNNDFIIRSPVAVGNNYRINFDVKESERNRSTVGYDFETEGTITVSVSFADQTNNTITGSFTLMINDVDESPVVVTTGIDISVYQGVTVSIPISRFVIDPEGVNIRLLDFMKPTWTSFDSTNQVFVISPDTTVNTVTTHGVDFKALAGTSTVDVTIDFDIDVDSDRQLVNCDSCMSWEQATTLATLYEEMHNALRTTEFRPSISISIASGSYDDLTFEYAGPDRIYFKPPVRVSSNIDIIFRSGLNYNFERKQIFTISIIARDYGRQAGAIGTTFMITDINESPSLTLSGRKRFLQGRTYARTYDTGISLSVNDPDVNDSFDFSISHTNFFVDNEKLIVKRGATFAYDANATNLLTVMIQAVDLYNSTSSVNSVIFNVVPRNDAPVVVVDGTQNAVDEGTRNAKFYTGLSLYVTNREATDTISFSTSDSRFRVDANDDNKFEIIAGSSFDFETEGTLTINVTTSDVINQVVSPITITFANVDEPPDISKTGTLVSLNEGTYNIATDTGFTIVAVDPEGANVTWSVSDARFQLASDGKLQIKANASFDYRQVTDRLIRVTITATDETSNAATDITEIVIHNVNDPPVISRAGSQAVLNEGVYVTHTDTGYSFTATDRDSDRLSFTVSDNTNFVIPIGGGNLQVRANASFDYETVAHRSHTLTITANDGALTATNVVTISISNVDEEPIIVQRGTTSLSESRGTSAYASNESTGAAIIITDPEGDVPQISYSNNNFIINPVNNNLEVKRGVFYDYENPAHREIVITITAQARSLVTTHTMTVTLSNVREGVALRNASVAQIEVDARQGMNIALAPHLIYDYYRDGIAYQLINPPQNWTSLAVDFNHAVLRGYPPANTTKLSVMFTIRVIQDDTTHNQVASVNTTVTLELPILVLRKNFDDISDKILPQFFDVVLSEGNDALKQRIAGLKDNNNQYALNDELVAALRANETMLESGKVNIYQLFQDRQLALGFLNNADGRTNLGFWTRFNFNEINAKDTTLDFDGSVSGLHAGIDYRFVDGGIMGLAYSNNRAEIDFTQRDNIGVVNGVYDINFNVIQPYYSNEFNNVDYWFSLSYGVGEVEITDKIDPSSPVTKDLNLLSAGVGFDTNVYDLFTGSLALISDLQLSEFTLEDKVAGTGERAYDKFNFKSGISYVYDIELDSSTKVNSEYGIAVVNRSTKGVADISAWGYEVFTTQEYINSDNPFRISGDLSFISLSSLDLSQFSGGVALIYRDDSSKLGSFVEINPAYRAKSAIDIFALEQDQDNELDDVRLLLSSKLGYGFGVVGGVLTPYGDYEIDHDSANYGLGIRYEQNNKFIWNLGVNHPEDKLPETKFNIEYKLIN